VSPAARDAAAAMLFVAAAGAATAGVALLARSLIAWL